MNCLLGVDGGQSHTTALVADARGRILGRGEAGPSNHTRAQGGRERLINAIDRSVSEALHRAGLLKKSGFSEFKFAGSTMIINDVVERLRSGIIVSCQAPNGSPLDDAYIISSLALTAAQNGAVGVRIDSPRHISATKERVTVPIIGIEKVVSNVSKVYITPTFDVAPGDG